jgi:hypothetical protein
MQPGWYDDPWQPGALRWWDGAQWTSNAAPRPGWPASAYPQQRAISANELGEQSGRASRASTALFVFAIAVCGQYFLVATLFYSVFHRFFHHRFFYQNENGYLVSQPVRIPIGHVLAIDGLGLFMLAVEIFLMVWLYNAAKIGQRLGMRQRLSPGWAIGGFFVPVVNLWFPYWVAADLLPEGDPARPTVGWWWGLWLAQIVPFWPILLVSIDSTTAAVILSAVCCPLPIAAAIKGRQVIAAVTTRQAALVPR